MKTITVRNQQGQVVSFNTSGQEGDQRLTIIRQRIARGELVEVDANAKSTRRSKYADLPEDPDAGRRDEKGDLLKSIHGGGVDPDADGDVLGQPSGSAKRTTKS